MAPSLRRSFRSAGRLLALLAGLSVATFAIPAVTGPAAASPTGTACGSSLHVVAPPTVAGSDSLNGVDVRTESDAWAVGSTQTQTDQQTISLRWDGTGWTQVATPDVDGHDPVLQDVVGLGASDAWAVGSSTTVSGDHQTLALHWDGGSWTQAGTPNPRRDDYLLAVDGVASGDVWAVGYHIGQGLRLPQSLALHWDGVSWSAVPTPAVGTTGNLLEDVVAIASDDVWAVGSSGGTRLHPLALHWDGASWKVVRRGLGSLVAANFEGVTAAGPHDVWAVGSYLNGQGKNRSLAEHWDGGSWSHVSVPDRAPYGLFGLTKVSAGSSTNVWAVGWYMPPGSRPAQAFAVRWQGSSWTLEPTPNPENETALNDVDVTAGGHVLAVGHTRGNRFFRSLIEEACTGP